MRILPWPSLDLSTSGSRFKRSLYKIFTLGSTDISPQALLFDNKAGLVITIIGIPSAFLLHGYVGFIFGSIKANPLVTLAGFQFYKPAEKIRRIVYFVISCLVLFGIFYMRWNVVIGGQLFSKSFYGFTAYKNQMIGAEGYLMAWFWFVVPFGILAFLLGLLPPWKKIKEEEELHETLEV